jgi:hypothetical protein
MQCRHDYVKYQKHTLKIQQSQFISLSNFCNFVPSPNLTFSQNPKLNDCSISFTFFNFMLSLHTFKSGEHPTEADDSLALDLANYFHLYIININFRPNLIICTRIFSILFPADYESNNVCKM